MEVSTQLITDLRNKFFKKLEADGAPDPDGFHPADIARIRDTDNWLKRFLQHNELNVQEALNMLWDSCDWRKKFGCNDITENNVRRDYLEEGIFFPHNKDKDGKTLLIFKSKLHFKGTKDFGELQRCIVYWFERLERQDKGTQISVFFDMADTGLSNLDMEFTKYLIGLFKTYYPNFLNYIIIYEMPWVLNTAFKIIKSWLPAKAIQKIKFVNKSTLKEYVDADNALTVWGGNDDYTFTFVPEERATAALTNGKLENKKVHFVDGSPMTEQGPSGFGDHENEESLLSIDSEVIVFKKEKNEYSGTISFKNITPDRCISYKIKTTSPDKFRVRPSMGVLQPAQNAQVTVMLQPGYALHGLPRNDKFLVMCLPMKDANASIPDLWKTLGKSAQQHRLRCAGLGSENGDTSKSNLYANNSGSSGDRSLDRLFSKVSQLEDCQNKLHADLVFSKRLQLISIALIVLMAIAVIYILRSDIRNAADQVCYHR
ncbi:motile sperm domain-containing protein 2-like [Diprion similis]|uniref:motile sperm domain-containing protein 2-like n=1 Tax=Diprion similis TaxID=362088 RepID=UPI001EF977AA|nr:motile sperm domain-containing protein 2-like [Diprion similis]